MIKDAYNRLHDYLRISLTDNCNLRCFYCMPDESYEFTPPSKLMQAEELLKLARIFVQEGVRKIRLTGGEPLIRKDAGLIIKELGKLPVDLSITTNGARLHDFLPILIQAGIKTVNISLDTLQEEKFFFITRRAIFKQVMDNIDLMLRHHIQVKINVVLMKNLNSQEIADFIDWTKNTPLSIRFIEFMPFTGNKWTSNQVMSLNEILAFIGEKYPFISLPSAPHDTAKHYKIPGFEGQFSIISTMSAPFCSDCNRIRLTADGKLKNCLFSKGETDLLTALRAQEDVKNLIHQNIATKAHSLGGQFSSIVGEVKADEIKNRSMITIGG